MILHKLTLQGSIGVERGLGMESISIPFGSFENGLILLQGRMGIGKSSIIKNLTPYRDLPGDKFADFKNHFNENGSKFLEFEFRNKHYLCQVYRELAKLFEDDSLLNKDEKLSSYDEVVRDRFGSKEYFFKMLFSGSAHKGMSDLTKGERKDVVINYLAPHLKQYEALKDLFDKESSETSTKLAIVRDRLTKTDHLRDMKDSLEASSEKYKKDLKELTGEISQLNKELTEHNKEYNRLDREVVKYKRIRQEKESLQELLGGKIDDLKKLHRELTEQINETNETVEEASTAYKEASKELEGLLKNKKHAEKKKKYKKELEEIQKSLHRYEDLNDRYRDLENDINRLDRQIVAFEKVQHPCGALLKENRKTLIKKKDALEAELDRFDIAALFDDQKRLNELISLADEYDNIYPVTLERRNNFNKTLETAEKSLRKLESKLKTVEKDLEGTERHLQSKLKKIEKELSNYDEIVASIDEIVGLIEVKEEEILDRNNQYRKISLEQSALQERISIVSEQLREADDDIKNEIRYAAMLKSYRQLIKFCGKEGYIVFDLESIGREISQIANEELLSYYECKKFSMEFETLKNKKEVFDILVSINGFPSQELSLCSTGEKVCCNVAIKEAMNYIREEKDFKTGFIDEIDGAIDPESRKDFFKMLKRCHKINNRYHTFLISHSTEIINEVYQRIELQPGKVSLIY